MVSSEATRPGEGGDMRRALFPAVGSMLIALVAVVPARAQTVEWIDQIGGAKTDRAWGVAYASGAVYVAGETSGHLAGQTSVGREDAWVQKYTPDGTLLWTRQFGTTAVDFGYGVAADSTGVYVTGITTGTFPGQVSAGAGDAYVRKYSPTGHKQWTVEFGTGSFDFAANVAVGPAGVSIVGATAGRFPGQNRSGHDDAFVAQFDTSGNQLWIRQFGTSGGDFPYAVANDGRGVVVGGTTDGTFPGQTSRGSNDAFVAAFGSTGHYRWLHEFGSKGYDVAYAAISSDGVLYFVGTAGGSVAGESYRGRNDALVRTYDETGTVRWTRLFGTRSYDEAFGVAIDPTGVYVSGTTGGAFSGSTNAGHTDVYVRAMNPNGVPQWTTQFGSHALDHGYGDVTDGNGAVFVIGETLGSLPGQTSSGDLDGYVAKVT